MSDRTAAFVEGQGISEDTAWAGIGICGMALFIIFVISQRVGGSHEKKSGGSDNAKTVEGHDEGTNGFVGEEAAALSKVGADDADESDLHVGVKEEAHRVTKMTKAFFAFQRSYVVSNVVASFADWLKGAYTMSIYVEFGFTLTQISLFFTVAFFSSVVFGTVAGAVSDTFGRVRSCRLYCIVYAASLILTTFNNVYSICLARALGGLATSLLATCFESWVVTEHHAQGFDPAWMQDTFSKTAVFSSASAVIAGFVAEAAVRAMGNVGPLLAPLPFLALSLVIMRNWNENYGDRTVSVYRTLANGWHDIVQSRNLQLLLLCEALYEGGLGVWLVMWTPSLDSTNIQTPFGLIFASYTLCMVSGGLLARMIPLNPLLTLCHGLGLLSMFLSAFCFHRKTLVYAAYLLYEVSTGTYMAAHPTLRSALMNDSSRASVMNLFRVPMNMIVVIVLLVGPSPLRSMWLLTAFQSISALALVILKQ